MADVEERLKHLVEYAYSKVPYFNYAVNNANVNAVVFKGHDNRIRLCQFHILGLSGRKQSPYNVFERSDRENFRHHSRQYGDPLGAFGLFGIDKVPLAVQKSARQYHAFEHMRIRYQYAAR